MRGAAKFFVYDTCKKYNLPSSVTFSQIMWNKSGVTKDKIVGVEIGVYYGINAFSMLLGMPFISTMHLVDKYGREFSKDAFKVANYLLQPFAKKLVWHIKDSVLAAGDFKDNSLDFVYIDGDHSYEGVMRDLEAWYPKAKPGAVFGGHDYLFDDSQKNGVRKAVKEWSSRIRDGKVNYKQESIDWWVKK